jgi:hypothetical protein
MDRLTAMQFSAPDLHPQTPVDPPAMVQTASREDVQWSRRIFKAPPLELHPQAFDATIFAQDLRRVGLSNR